MWGRRLGRGRARALGWAAGTPGVMQRELRGGGQGSGGEGLRGGGGGEGGGLEGAAFEGGGSSGSGGGAGGVGVICPSRRTIVEVCREGKEAWSAMLFWFGVWLVGRASVGWGSSYGMIFFCVFR